MEKISTSDTFKKIWASRKENIFKGAHLKSNILAIRIVSCIMIAAMSIFVVLNILDGIFLSALYSSIMILIFVAIAIIVKSNRGIACALLMVAFAALCTEYTILGTSGGFSILWTLIIPMAVMYFLGIQWGLHLVVYYGLLFVVCFWTPLKANFEGLYTPTFMERYPILYFFANVIVTVAMLHLHYNTLIQLDYNEKLEREVDLQTQKANIRRERMEKMSFEMVQVLTNAIDAKDKYTNGHSTRVSEYAVRVAKELGWDEESINALRFEAQLHDAGKIGIPDEILNKDGRLTEEEYEIMPRHSEIGAKILEGTTELPGAVLVARHHHERYDGMGYPDHLKGEEIPEHARLVCVVDAFDAMNSDRIYRKAMSHDEIKRELENGSGKQFDPKFVKVFLQLWESGRLEEEKTES